MTLFMDPPLNGNPAWLSQALAVVNHTNASQPVDRPLLDTTDDQVMTITVGNNSATDVTNVFVQYWVCAFSTVVSGPLYLPTAGGAKGKQIDPSSPSSHTVPGHLNHVFEDPFKPTSAEVAPWRDPANPTADMHACTLANTFSGPPTPQGAKIMASAASPPHLDPSWNPGGNPLQAQRNMALVTPTDAGARKMDFMMHIGNPDPKVEANFQLEIRETQITRPQIGQLELDHLLRHPRIVQLEPIRPTLTVRRPRFVAPALAAHIGDELVPIRLATKPLRDLQIDAGRIAAPRTRVTLARNSARQIRLQATLPAEENTLRIFDVVQTRDGKTVGGARVMFLNAPAEFRRPFRILR